ncbi:MAG: NFACT family protein [Candidatus Thermoplasmatota archaeon]|nr:fibronectin-binding domain-containing protein [Euryarchaeota archaeon]MBU4032413.1 NFACT family protein [Candidatus Thermoplasmatota archaeon]MBU4071827.1 NFACT family protein [Candidatus Thermoplasmatota archaeon]MBU4144970.1 NFACT family protein [Candidatus Thermoplasmatota archaeon]MBU4592481.1 NFACT family protein [Candidatus Thermoplasmatota archaeon]
MKSQMSSFDIAAVVREMQSCIGLKAEKFFLPEHRDLFFRLTGPGGKKTVVIKLGRGIWLEEGFRTIGDSAPPTFAMLLRKYVSGKALVKVSQHGFDRVIVFTFNSEPEIKLVAEMFGSGNLILLEGERIIQPLTSKSWKARDIKAGRNYLFPPESGDPFSLDRESLTAILRNSEKDLVRCLATEVNLSGVYSEDICTSLGVGKNTKASELTDEDIMEVMEIIGSFGSGLENPEPHILLDDEGKQTDVQPFKLGVHEALDKKDFDTFSSAAREYFESLREAEVVRKNPRLVQLENQLESQMEAVGNLDIQAEERQKAGDALYASYGVLDAILKKTSKILAGGNWQALKKDVESIPQVNAFDPANGVISVTISEDSILKLDVRKDLNENAADFYDSAKKARHKAEGAREAILDTEKLLKDVLEADEIAAIPADKMPTKRFWFDRFRWFLSSDGLMVVGGRDTRSNDQVVKKHLKDEDLYAHADVNGAPSVVIKEGGARATEATLEEACTFAVAFSRAWKSKLASGSAYWVKPDQVSKTPQPGEFVPKGAFIIRGKRNYSKKIDIRLAIGMVNINGADKVMCGPVNAVKALAKEYFIIEPGEEKRTLFAKKLSDLYKIPIEEIDRVLPTGDVRVLKD